VVLQSLQKKVVVIRSHQLKNVKQKNKIMNTEGRKYFQRQEEEISNKYMSASGEGNVDNTVKQAGMGAGLFTMAVVLVGIVYLSNKILAQK